MDLQLKEKVAIVSGSSEGIGFGIAHQLALEGAMVVLNGRNEQSVETAVDKIRVAGGGSVHGVVGDVTDAAAAESLIGAAVETFGRLDILVNNVGRSNPMGLLETTDEEWLDAFQANLFHAVRLSRLAIPRMDAVGGGAILNVSSIAGREAGSAMTYNAAKAALISFSKALAQEKAAQNIRVNSIAPGSVWVPGGVWERRKAASPDNLEGFMKANMPLGRFGLPEEVAAVAVFMVSPRASLVNGACWNVDGCQSRSNI